MTQRFKLLIEYDGTPYNGWQRQDDAPSVQGAIEQAVYQFAQENVTLHVAGRTDAGVHALAQVAHFDLAAERDVYQVREGLNFFLQNEAVVIVDAEAVSDDFHARFSATQRRYRYRIVNRKAPLRLDALRAWHVPYALDIAAMQRASQRFIGEHDFTSFRASACQSKSPVKTLDVLDVSAQGEDIIIIAEARSFLHHQVRNLVGALVEVGCGKWTPDDIDAALAARDRRAGAATAPAHGLYLTGVIYP